jgi:cytochrome c
LIYEWVRGWVKAVTMAPNGDYVSMEPFMANVPLAAPIDMELGPDNKLYVLEYGKGWFAKNPDAALVRIDYNNGAVAKPATVAKAGATTMGHQTGTASKESIAKAIMAKTDCLVCHKATEKSVGPAYNAVAAKYKDDPKAVEYLTNKIIKGGAGVWGEVPMPPHSTMKVADVKSVVDWILTLK